MTGLHRDPHGQRREPARRLRLLPRHDARAPRGAAGRVPEVLHGVRDPPHDDALGPHARAGAARAARPPGSARCPAAAPRCSPTACAASSRPARSTRTSGSTCTTPRTGSGSRRTAPSSTATSRPTRSGSTTCCACATSRTRRAASSPSSRSRSIPENTVFERRGFTLHDRRRRPEDAGRLAPDARQHREHQGLLDLDDDAARPGRAPLRRERHPGHASCARRSSTPPARHRDRAEARGARPRRPRRRPHPRAARHVLQRAAALAR